MKLKKSFIILFALALLVGFAPSFNSKEAYAAEEFVAKAKNIAVNTTVTSQLKTYADYYKVTAPANGQLTFTAPNSKDEFEYYLSDENGYEYDSFITDSTVSGNSKTFLGVKKGQTIYLRITHEDGVGNSNYSLNVSFAAGENYEKEFNDTLWDANLIKVNTTIHSAYSRDDIDYYKFTLTKAGLVEISMPNGTLPEKELVIMDSKGEKINTLHTYEDKLGKETLSVGLAAGTYYIYVDRYIVSYSYITTPYTFDLKFKEGNYYDKEYNDTITRANSINLNTNYTGFHSDDDVDYFTFKLTKKEAIKMNLSTTLWEKEMYLLDSKGNFIGDSLNAEGKNATVSKKVTLSPGTYFIRVDAQYVESFSDKYTLNIQTISPTLSSKQVSVTNNKGKNDTLTVTGIKSGDTVKVYDKSSGGKLLVSKKATGSSVSLSHKQFGEKSGKVYVSLTRSNLAESNRLAVSYKAEPTKALISKQVKIQNNYNKSDTVSFTGLKKNDTIKIYDKSSGGKVLSTTKSKGTSLTATIKQLGKKSGKVYVSVTNYGLGESSRLSISFKAEPSAPLKSSQVKVTNNKGKDDKVVVKSIKKGDTIKIYNSKSKLISSKKANSSSVTFTVKQLGKSSGNILVTTINSGQLESSKLKVSYSKEK